MMLAGYLIALGIALAFSIFYYDWLSFYVLVVVLLIPVLDLIASLVGMLSVRLTITVPDVAEQDGNSVITVAANRRRFSPVGRITLRMKLTAPAGVSRSKRLTLHGRNAPPAVLPVDTTHSGLITYQAGYAWASSLLGLFAFPVPVKCAATTLVLPVPMELATMPKLSAAPLRPKPGGGFAEEYEVRPYRPGDPVSGVHWKLSAKYDELMIREAMEYPTQRRLLLVAPWNTPAEGDLALGRLRWLSDKLLAADCPHDIRLEASGATGEIRGSGDLAVFLRRALNPAPSTLGTGGSSDSFEWVFPIDGREVTA